MPNVDGFRPRQFYFSWFDFKYEIAVLTITIEIEPTQTLKLEYPHAVPSKFCIFILQVPLKFYVN